MSYGPTLKRIRVSIWPGCPESQTRLGNTLSPIYRPLYLSHPPHPPRLPQSRACRSTTTSRCCPAWRFSSSRCVRGESALYLGIEASFWGESPPSSVPVVSRSSFSSYAWAAPHAPLFISATSLHSGPLLPPRTAQAAPEVAIAFHLGGLDVRVGINSGRAPSSAG